MTRDDEIRELYAFNRWANARIFDAAAALDGEELDCDLVSSFPSVRSTLAHMAGAEWVWVSRWEGKSPRAMPAELAGASLAGVRDWLEAVQVRQDVILASLTEARMDAGFVYTDFAGNTHDTPFAATLRHVVNHASYHRGQVVTMLRQIGRKPPVTDLIVYHRELARV